MNKEGLTSFEELFMQHNLLVRTLDQGLYDSPLDLALPKLREPSIQNDIQILSHFLKLLQVLPRGGRVKGRELRFSRHKLKQSGFNFLGTLHSWLYTHTHKKKRKLKVIPN